MPICCHYNYDSAINDASFSHDSQLIAMGGEEHTVKINHASTGETMFNNTACFAASAKSVGSVCSDLMPGPVCAEHLSNAHMIAHKHCVLPFC